MDDGKPRAQHQSKAAVANFHLSAAGLDWIMAAMASHDERVCLCGLIEQTTLATSVERTSQNLSTMDETFLDCRPSLATTVYIVRRRYVGKSNQLPHRISNRLIVTSH
jgi:hypothetical protein